MRRGRRPSAQRMAHRLRGWPSCVQPNGRDHSFLLHDRSATEYATRPRRSPSDRVQRLVVSSISGGVRSCQSRIVGMRTSSRGGLPKTFGRKSQQWEAELQLLAAETTRLEAPKPPVAVTTEKTLELAKQAENLYKLCYRTVRLIGEVFCLLTISIRPVRSRQRNWGMAWSTGLVPADAPRGASRAPKTSSTLTD